MDNPKVKQDEINSIAWRACDTFRGVVDPSEYKNYILVFLFIKYLSDVWKDKQEEYQRKYNGDKERVKRALSLERFIVPDISIFDFLYTHRNETNVGELINIALETLEEANKGKLDGVFRNIDFNSESALGRTKDRNVRLKHLIEDFADPKLDLRPSQIGNQDIIGNTYEYLIARFASDAGKKGGEFYTPAEVSILTAKLLDPQPGDRICDPTCGSGSLLIRVGKEVGSNNFSLYGQESNGSTWALCKMNMFLHGMDTARIEWGDTIGNPLLIENDHLMKFDKVVANPPFSLDKWGAETAETDHFNRFWRGIPPKSVGDYAFISHMIESTNSSGKVAVVVPHGVLFRQNSEGKIRRQLIENNLIEAIIGLPTHLFYGTGIATAILILNKNKSKNEILIIDASRDFEENGKQNKLREGDIEKIVTTYKKFKSVDHYSYLTDVAEVQINNYNLNIAKYVDVVLEENNVDIPELIKKISLINISIEELENKIIEDLKELGYVK